MKKQDYTEAKEKINKDIRDLKILLAAINTEYIQANYEYEIGEKVKIITPQHTAYNPFKQKETIRLKQERFAFISDYYISDNCVRYELFKCKKDGTASKHHDSYLAQFFHKKIWLYFFYHFFLNYYIND